MGRSRLALTHLLPSLLVLTIIGSLILFTWYPYPFLQFRHSDKFSLALILSAGLLGPALTWLVYKADKRALAFDLALLYQRLFHLRFSPLNQQKEGIKYFPFSSHQ